jgi:ABC-2 type transport system permease protein
MKAFFQLFLANIKIVYRNKSGFFWSIAVPVGLYIALAALPIPNVSPALNYKNFALPGVIAYVIMQSGVYTLAYWMVDLKARGVIKRFLVTPLKNSDLVLSLITARLTIILIQIVLITLIGVIFFHATFAGNVVSALIISLLGGGIFLLIGLLISNAASSYETAAPITAAIGMPFAFLGNLFVPISILPRVFQIISQCLPISYLANGLRQAYLYPFNFTLLLKDILFLSLWFIGFLILTVSIFKLKEE